MHNPFMVNDPQVNDAQLIEEISRGNSKSLEKSV